MKDYQKYNDKLFSRWAPIYDGFELVLFKVRDQITEAINPKGKAALDVATGTGSLAISLSHKAKTVVGIDLSAKMLDVAKKKRTKENLSFLQMDASKMTFPDHEFDIVTISLGLHDMPLDIRTLVLQEVKRVLKKEGELYILEHDMPANNLFGKLSTKAMNLIESKYYLDFLESDFELYLQTCGFEIEQKTSYLFGHLQFLKLSNKTP